MFENIGWGKLLVLVIAGLFILGPERLPTAAAWLGRAVRQVRDYATGARDQLRSELGPEFDELRKPLQDLQSLRSFNPRQAVTRHLFEGDDTWGGINELPSTNGQRSSAPPPPARPPAQPPLQPGERPPFDSDAT